MPFKIPQYPDALTNASWQKNKGLIAKMAGETGIGDLMKKAVTAYGAVDWRKFKIAEVAAGSGMGRTQQDIDDAVKEALKEGPKIKALDKAVRDIEVAAKKLAADWKNNKKIPAASVKYAQEISDAALAFDFQITMGTISAALMAQKKETEDSLKALHAEFDKLNDKLREYIDKFEGEAKKATLAKYTEFWSEYIRGPGTVLPTLIKNHPEIKADWEIWKQFSNKLKVPESEEEFQTQIANLVKVAKDLKPKIANI